MPCRPKACATCACMYLCVCSCMHVILCECAQSWHVFVTPKLYAAIPLPSSAARKNHPMAAGSFFSSWNMTPKLNAASGCFCAAAAAYHLRRGGGCWDPNSGVWKCVFGGDKGVQDCSMRDCFERQGQLLYLIRTFWLLGRPCQNPCVQTHGGHPSGTEHLDRLYTRVLCRMGVCVHECWVSVYARVYSYAQ